MTRAPGYPLERLKALRDQRASGAAIDLAGVLRGVSAAENEVAWAAAARDRAVAAVRAVELCAGDETPAWAIVQRAAYATRLRREVERAQANVAACDRELTGWRELAEAARSRMAATRADREVIARHRTRWEDEQRRVRERRES